MKFPEVVEQASALLQCKGRITYRALKRECHLEDDALEDLKFELITGQELAVDKDGDVLVWIGEGVKGRTGKGINGRTESGTEADVRHQTPNPELRTSQPPASYTPAHLAERIRAGSLTEGE